MVDVRRLKMLQMVQLFKCEEDAAQVRNRAEFASHLYFASPRSVYYCEVKESIGLE